MLPIIEEYVETVTATLLGTCRRVVDVSNEGCSCIPADDRGTINYFIQIECDILLMELIN